MPPTAINSTAEDAPEISKLKLSPEANVVRGLLPLEKTPGIISLLAGKPNQSTFPIDEISITLRAPDAPQPYSPSGGEPVRETLKIDGNLLATALQYNFTDGVPDLRALLADFQLKEHGITVDDVNLQLTVGSGSQDLMYKIFTCLLDPGDAILVEAPVYAGVLPILQTLEPDMIEVETDPSGISIDHLRGILSDWPKDKPKPKALYTVPYGCNPTGATTPLNRRQEVLRLAEEHDFLILEGGPFIQVRFQRRVLRLDSFSKVLSSGRFDSCAYSLHTEPKIIYRYAYWVRNWSSGAHQGYELASANLQANSTTQVIALAMLKHWGYDGFRAHINNISGFYRAKRDAFEAAMYKHFKPEGEKPLAEWTRPEAGLFFWFRLNVPDEDSYQLISTKALAGGVIAVPGQIFFPSGRKTAYVRTAFSVMDIELVDEALRRLAKVVREVIDGA
ncbi:aromatic amino acid transaminase [Rhizoctonia solani AG-1 IA]|uniref:Aromatic amino acid transaminase n=1 Tax=Thanatephorus cucumeris (strain AG1-IA) TaxID=983506 RepID=L8WKW1_THACA|nr:aromatic amino acid transaminase [Rhizoctonia solani AG-1 IA]